MNKTMIKLAALAVGATAATAACLFAKKAKKKVAYIDPAQAEQAATQDGTTAQGLPTTQADAVAQQPTTPSAAATTPKDCHTRAEKAEQVDYDYYAAVRNAYDNGPNANPVYSPKVETPRTQDGKIDVTKLAAPEDFYNWEEHGCQS